MSMGYPFPPQLARFQRHYAFWRGDPVNADSIQRALELCEKLPREPATVGGGKAYNELTKTRRSEIAWVPFPGENKEVDTEWLYALLTAVSVKINQDFFGFRLYGFMERLQYTVYDAPGAHYSYHVDSQGADKYPRKLSFSFPLDKPTTFEGGELWVAGIEESVIPKDWGVVHYFPSYSSHRVTPVTKGTRRSIVGWISGEDFQ